jgi:predicted DNA repair protein MutK
VLVGISLIMTIGVYGLVGGIVKIDDAGLHLSRSTSSAAQSFGRGLLVFAPWLMKTLSVLGTAAMFLVGGGILLHGVPALGHAVEHWAEGLGAASGLINSLAGGLAGVVAGALAVVVFNAVNKLRGKTAH